MFIGIKELKEKKLAGLKLLMSFADNRTGELWGKFMPERKRLNALSNELFSVEIYSKGFFDQFNPSNKFEKWAAIEVEDFTELPQSILSLVIPAGVYAVFMHHGPASQGPKTYNYIFNEWLPMSGYEIDQRPHFALMGEKYQNDSPDSEEEIWIPIK